VAITAKKSTRKPPGRSPVRNSQLTEDQADAIIVLRRLKRNRTHSLEEVMRKFGYELDRSPRRRRN